MWYLVAMGAGAMLSYQGQKIQANHRRNAGKKWAAELRRQAALQLDAGEESVWSQRMGDAQIKSAAKLAYAVSGTDAEESGFRQTNIASAIQTEKIRMNARRAAHGLRVQADMEEKAADAEHRAAAYQRYASLLGTGASMYGMSRG